MEKAGFMSLDTTASISGRFSDVAAPPMMSHTALTQQVLPQPAPTSLLDAFSSRTRPNETGPADPMRDLQGRLQAATMNTSKTWKAADNINSGAVIKGADGLAQSHGTRKAMAAETMQAAQVGEIKNILKDMAAAGGGPAQPGAGGAGTGLVGSLATDALLTTGMTLAMGPVGGLVATGLMAARAGLSGTGLEGQGTLVTFNQNPGYYGSTSSSKGSRAKDNTPTDYGYGSSPSPGQQAGAAPASNAFQKAMNQGPGFGRADLLADSQMPKNTFEDMALKIAADSPAGKAMEGMRLNSRKTSDSLLVQREGIDVNENNLNDAMDIGLKMPQGPKIQTFKMA